MHITCVYFLCMAIAYMQLGKDTLLYYVPSIQLALIETHIDTAH